MKKINTTLLISAVLSLSAPVMAAGFGHQQDLTVAGQALHITETSARVLGNAQGQPALVDDITDGLGKTKIPGFKMMVMSRAASVAFEGRQSKEGTWRDNRAIHRGSKVTFGVPVINGKPDIGKAVLLDMAVITDKPEAASFKVEDKIRPRGQQLLQQDTRVGTSRLHITALQLPDMTSGERSGGGIKLTASTILDGKPVHATVNSTFQTFEVATPEMGRLFAADPRFVKP